ncbi:S49 family peptidase [Halobacterium litoreum]|uniref:S49 family peptidase n=1 Tax=Halobacterium litoreum TaxID=2039234 RepID=A0ABD5NH83_9EURY|nr:S49 family peptidase [Halobacterium litoreum]UHH12453.1 S49 family peptidase [Halobacterium litoreum]
MSRASARGTARTVTLVFAVVGVVAGAALAPQALSYAQQSDGKVAVVELHGTITGDSASAVVQNLREARQNASIEAVVLDVNSPGGTASASEQLYLAVKRTAGEMPVVTSVTGTAASGSYYASAPTDHIFVTPASVVGSVGVRATLPSQGVPPGEVVTGPDKGSGSTPDEVRQRVETLRRAFVGSVMAERGDELELSREEVSHAKVYAGARGVNNGLADEIGGIDAAISTAAEDAGLNDYDVVRMESPQVSLLSQLGLEADGDVPSPSTEQVFEYRGVDTVQYLMLHGAIETDSAERTDATDADRATASQSAVAAPEVVA